MRADCVGTLVEPYARAGGWPCGCSGRSAASEAVTFGAGAPILCGAGFGLYAGSGGAGDGAGGIGVEPEVGSNADSGGVLWGTSAGAYVGPALSLWRRDAPP